jgi:hypothetical protein
MPENPVPEGRTSLAQRGSAGKNGTIDSSPGGTTEPHAHTPSYPGTIRIRASLQRCRNHRIKRAFRRRGLHCDFFNELFSRAASELLRIGALVCA